MHLTNFAHDDATNFETPLQQAVGKAFQLIVDIYVALRATRSWSTKFDMRSPCYTTCVAELPVIG